MIVTEKNSGAHIPYKLEGTTLSFRSGAFILDLSKYERDYPVHLDISENESGALVLGPSRRYVAELDIPARAYCIEAGEADDCGFPKLRKLPKPLDTDLVKMTLWAMEV